MSVGTSTHRGQIDCSKRPTNRLCGAPNVMPTSAGFLHFARAMQNWRMGYHLMAYSLHVVRAALAVKPRGHRPHRRLPHPAEKRWRPSADIPMHRPQRKSPLPAFVVPAQNLVVKLL